MKRTLIIALIACGSGFALCPAIHAQDASPSPSAASADDGSGGGKHGGFGRRGGGGMNIDRLTTALSLTPDEVKAITPILDQEKTDMQALRSDTSTPQADKMAKFKEIRDAANAKISAQLTPDQQTKFAAMQTRMRGGRHGGGAPDAAPSTSGS